MQKTPDISIVIPIYNVEKYLRICLDSVLAQTHDNWEAICVDDDSPDRCPDILDTYAHTDKRMKVIHLEKNSGIVIARKCGVEKTQGKYIMFLDGDDYLEPNAFETILQEEIKQSADIIEFWCSPRYEIEYSEDMKKCIEAFFNKPEYSCEGDMLINCFVKDKFIVCLWQKCFRGDNIRRAYKLMKAIHCVSMEDTYAFFFIAQQTMSFRRTNNILINYRCGFGISTESELNYEKFKQAFDDHNRVLNAIEEDIIRNNMELKYPKFYNVIFKKVLRVQIERLGKIHDIKDFLLGLSLITDSWGAEKVIQGLDDLHMMPFPEFVKLQHDITDLQYQIASLEQKIKTTQKSYEAINHSLSFRLGRAVTFLPRLVRDVLK